MPKVAPQLSRFKGKEVQRRQNQEQGKTENKKKKTTFVQSGKPIEFGPGWDKLAEEQKHQKWKRNKTRTPRSPYMTQKGAKNLDARRELALGKVGTQQEVLEVEKKEMVVPVMPAQRPRRSTLSKLAEMANSSLDLVTLGFTSKFLKKK